MTAKTVDIADALVTALAAEGFTNVYRRYFGAQTLEELHDEHLISVIPQGDTRKVNSRTTNQEFHQLAIVYQEGLERSNAAAIDTALETVEDIKALWADSGTLRRAAIAGARWTETIQNSPLYHPDHLLQKEALLTSVIIVTYTITR